MLIAWMSEIGARVRGLFRRQERDLDFEAELRSHFEMLMEENRARGMSDAEARRAARIRLGGAEKIQEAHREQRGLPFLETLWQDIRYGARQLRRSPGFTAVAVITLGLGIGADAGIFSVVNGVLLKALPYSQPEQLFVLKSYESLPDLEDLQRQTHSFAAIGGVNYQALDYTGGAEPVQIEAALCNREAFEVFGARPLIGRLLSAEEDRYGGARAVILSYAFWQAQFGGDREILGKSIPLSGNSYTVIGVLPADFWVPGLAHDVWASLRVVNPNAAQFRGVHFLRTYVRLKPGVTRGQVKAELQTADEWLARNYADKDAGRHRDVLPLLESVVGEIRPTLLILFGSVAFVLLIACSNFAGLLLARSSTRQQEIDVRVALGAGRARLIRQMLTESTMLALLGGVLGLVLAHLAVAALIDLKPANLPRIPAIQVDWRVVAYAMGISLLTGIVFGLAPAWRAVRRSVEARGTSGSRGASAGARTVRLRQLLVAGEIALALVLLSAAGLLIKSFWLLMHVNPGFGTENRLTMRMELPEARYKELATQREMRRQLLDGLNSLPGVRAALVSELPLSGEYLMHNLAIEGRPPKAPGDEPEVVTRTVAGEYFRVMQIPLVRGRNFGVEDREGTPVVVVVNQSFAREYFPGEDPIGRRIRWAWGDANAWMTIVGIAGDVKHFGLDQPEDAAVYDLYSQTQQPWKRWMWVVTESRAPGDVLVAEIRGEVRKLDAQLPLAKIHTMEDVRSDSVAAQRFNADLLAILAAVALALASVGTYGLLAFAVGQRTREIGIRMALGAAESDVLGMVMRQGGLLIAAGLAIGTVAALGLTRLLSSLLFEVRPADPLTMFAAIVTLGAAGLVACYVPARRAMRVDPIVALRYE
jgi:putative ABC transport system permease protein